MNEEQRVSRVATTPEGAVAYDQTLADAGMDDEETIFLLETGVSPNVRPRPRLLYGRRPIVPAGRAARKRESSRGRPWRSRVQKIKRRSRARVMPT